MIKLYLLWSLADGELFPRIIPKCCKYYFKLITKILSYFYRKVMATLQYKTGSWSNCIYYGDLQMENYFPGPSQNTVNIILNLSQKILVTFIGKWWQPKTLTGSWSNCIYYGHLQMENCFLGLSQNAVNIILNLSQKFLVTFIGKWWQPWSWSNCIYYGPLLMENCFLGPSLNSVNII